MDTVAIDPRRTPTLQLFGLVGGISFFSLLINGSTAGFLLKYLKLNRATEERTNILKSYDNYLKKRTLDVLIILLGEKVYKDIDFNLVAEHIHPLADLTYKDIRAAIRRVKYSRPSHLYSPPELSVFEPILTSEELKKLESLAQLKLFERIQSDYITGCVLPDELHSDDSDGSDELIKELRMVFLELVRRAYQNFMTSGYIDVRDGAVVHVLNSSIAVTEDEISNNLPLNDWFHTQRFNSFLEKFEKTATKVHLATAFIQAHNEAQKTFKFKVHQDGFLSTAERKILAESSNQVEMAYEQLETFDPLKLKNILSVTLSVILLNNAAIEISELVNSGLLKEEEGEHYFEHLEHDINVIKGTKKKVKHSPPESGSLVSRLSLVAGRGSLGVSRGTFLNVNPTEFTNLRAEYDRANTINEE